MRRLTWLAAAACLLLINYGSARTAVTRPATRPAGSDHSRLLVYVGDQGREQPVRTPEDWARRRRAILTGMQEAMGPLPGRDQLPPPDVKVTEEVKLDGCTRLTLSFVAAKRADGGGDERVPAYLFLPAGQKQGTRSPAMIAL